jgi:hypothetical protein
MFRIPGNDGCAKQKRRGMPRRLKSENQDT